MTEIVKTIQNISDDDNCESEPTDNYLLVASEEKALYHFQQGLKNFENRNNKEAKSEFLKSLEWNAHSIDANFNIAILLRDEKEYRNAIHYFTKVTQLDQQNFIALFNIAFCYEMLKKYDEAILFYEEAQKISQDNSLLYFNLGNIFKELKDWLKAKENYAKALSIEPNNTNYLINIAAAYYFTGFFKEAISVFHKILDLDPDNISAKINYAAALVEIEKYDESLRINNSLLKTNNEDAKLHYNFAVLLLLLGNYEQGFKEYEWRLTNKEKYNSYPEIPFWNGEELSGKRIVVIDEQGIGDTFQFVRYFKFLKEDGAEVIFSCRNALVNFMELTVGEQSLTDNIIPLGTPVEADYKIYMMSLPLKYLPKENNLRFKFPYLNFSSDASKNFSIGIDEHRLNIGIVWRGNPEHKYDFKRSVKIEKFLNMVPNENIKLFSLQNDITEEEKEILNSNNIVDLTSHLEPFIETAAIIKQLDLIISVDTAAAHLAGALNKKTFLLLSKVPDWRWELKKNSTELYPSLRIFRQERVGDWTTVFDNVKIEVERTVENYFSKRLNNSAILMNIKLKGLEAFEKKQYAEAINNFEKYLSIETDDLELLFWHGCAYYNLNMFEKAEEIFLKLEKTDIQHFEVLSLLGKLYLQQNKFDFAENYYSQALVKEENNELLNGIGISLQKQGKFSEATTYFERAIENKPNIAGNHLNYANNCYYQQRFDEAIKHFNLAIEYEDLLSAHVGKSFVHLALKDFRTGFNEYQWSLTKYTPPNESKAIKWIGQYAKDKSIFIYAEQGLGDAIQFARFLPIVKEKGLNITLRCPEPLKKFFEAIPFITGLSDTILPDTDFYCSLINLPNVLGLYNVQDFTLPEKIFNVDKELIKKWKLLLNKEKYNVGLVFETKSKSLTTADRNIPFHLIESLIENEKIDFYLLQKEYGNNEYKSLVDKYSNVQIVSKNIVEVAALIKNLDIVITIDSMVANLAGTLNKETWVMLPFVSDWRWTYTGEDSYWYPSVKLFRQTEFNNWTEVISKVKSALNNKVQLFSKKNNGNSSEIIEIKELLNKHNLEDAKNKLLNILQKYPDNAEANFYLGYICQLENDFRNAASQYSKVLSIVPAHFDALNNLAVVLKDLGRFSDAKEFLDYAKILNNNNSSVYNNLGIVNDLLGNFEEAIANFEKAISINPNYEEALLNYGNTLQTEKQYSKAIQVLDNLLEINPQNVGGNFNKALTLLSMGNYKKGFELYEWRRKRADFVTRNFTQPELTDQTIEGKTILVYDEQGLGDTIQFCRYVKLLSEKNTKVILQCHSALSDMLKGCRGVYKVIARESLNDPDIQYDYHIPLLSLPKYFNTSLKTLPATIPYISVAEGLTEKFHSKYFANGKVNIGIVWEGKTPVGNAHRACPMEFFTTLIGEAKYEFFSLQKGEAAYRDKQKMNKHGIIDLSDELNSFNETAAIIKNLNLVITIDTSVAHLAGALGIKTYTLLSYKSDWRWQNNNDWLSIWYPQMKLIKQKKFGEWKSIFEKINFLLKKEKWISQTIIINNNKRS